MDIANNTLPSPDSNFCMNIRIELDHVKDPFYREPNTRIFVTVLYTSVACMGAIGNFFVIAAVVKNPQMRTPRNYFIINLALSDLLMCTLAVPFTLYYVLNTFWDLGSTACKIVASAQGVNIFVSAMSITAIGLDRYWVILFPTKTQQQRVVIVICFTSIWIFSFLLAFPLFYATDTQFPTVLQPVASCGVYLLVCSESWDKMFFGKRFYTISSTAFQYVLPLTMLTFVYARIIWRLENRVVYRQRAMTAQIEQTIATNGTSTMGTTCRIQNRRRSLECRQRRMNLLLICVVAFFAFCWLPLNVYNALLSFDLALYNVVAFSSCHVFGMMSACANPILYGVFNENFRQEFISILACLRVLSIIRYIAKFTTASRTAAAGGTRGSEMEDHHHRQPNAQQLTNVRTSMKRGQGSRRISNRSAADDFQKLLDIPFSSSIANGCSVTNSNYSPSPTPYSELRTACLETSRSVESITNIDHNNKFTVSTPQEDTPLFSHKYPVGDGNRTYALITDL